MEKKVVAIGNGLAVFIDKAYQRELDIRANTLIRMTSDGVRLVIEPAGQRRVRPKLEPWDAPAFLRVTSAQTSEERRLEYYAAGIFMALEKRGFSDEHFARLHHYWDYTDFYSNWLCRRPLFARTEDYQSLRRIALCWERVQAGSTLHDAVEYAAAQIPMAPTKRWAPFGKRGPRNEATPTPPADERALPAEERALPADERAPDVGDTPPSGVV